MAENNSGRVPRSRAVKRPLSKPSSSTIPKEQNTPNLHSDVDVNSFKVPVR